MRRRFHQSPPSSLPPAHSHPNSLSSSLPVHTAGLQSRSNLSPLDGTRRAPRAPAQPGRMTRAASPSWYAEVNECGTNLWDIEPGIQVVGMTERESLVLGGCRTAAIRWKEFPSVSFAMRIIAQPRRSSLHSVHAARGDERPR